MFGGLEDGSGVVGLRNLALEGVEEAEVGFDAISAQFFIGGLV